MSALAALVFSPPCRPMRTLQASTCPPAPDPPVALAPLATSRTGPSHLSLASFPRSSGGFLVRSPRGPHVIASPPRLLSPGPYPALSFITARVSFSHTTRCGDPQRWRFPGSEPDGTRGWGLLPLCPAPGGARPHSTPSVFGPGATVGRGAARAQSTPRLRWPELPAPGGLGACPTPGRAGPPRGGGATW